MEDKVVATRLGMWRSWICRLGPRLRRLVCRESERVWVWVCGCVPIVVVGVDRMRDKDILAFLLCMKVVLTGARYRPGHRSRGRIPHLVSLLLPPALTGPAV